MNEEKRLTVKWKDVTRFLCYHRLSEEEYKKLDSWMREGIEPDEVLENLMNIMEERFIKKDRD